MIPLLAALLLQNSVPDFQALLASGQLADTRASRCESEVSRGAPGDACIAFAQSYYLMVGRYREARAWFDAALADSGQPPSDFIVEDPDAAEFAAVIDAITPIVTRANDTMALTEAALAASEE